MEYRPWRAAFRRDVGSDIAPKMLRSVRENQGGRSGHPVVVSLYRFRMEPPIHPSSPTAGHLTTDRDHLHMIPDSVTFLGESRCSKALQKGGGGMEWEEGTTVRGRGGFYLGDAHVIPQRGLLVRGREVHRLERKVMAVLLCLVEQPGEVVTRDEIVGRVWKESGATADLLSRAVGRIRRAFAACGIEAEIETVRGVGYCLVGSVRHEPRGRSDEPPAKRARWWVTPLVASGLSFAASAVIWITSCLITSP